LLGTVLSGWMYQVGGMPLCLLCSSLMVRTLAPNSMA
jgi:hypothetical protein